MRYHIILIQLIIAVVVLSSNDQSDTCQQYILNQSTLLIPERLYCRIYQEEIMSFIQIDSLIINGTLKIDDNISLYLKLKHFKIGAQGHLQIGQEYPIINNSIVIEIANDEECNLDNPPQGYFNIQSIQYKTYQYEELYLKKVIKLYENPYYLSRLDDIQLIKPLDSNQLQAARIDKIHDRHVELQITNSEYQILENQYMLDNKFYLISDSRSFSGVKLINMCLNVNVEEISGVNFINTRGLKLNGQIVKNSLFKNEIQELSSTFIFEINFENNIFYQLSQMNISAFNKNAIGNSFIQVRDLKISKISEINNSLIFNSNLQLSPSDQSLIIYNSTISYSKISVELNEKPLKNIYLKYSQFYNEINMFKFPTFENLNIHNCLSANASFGTIQSNSQVINLQMSEFYGFNQINSLFEFEEEWKLKLNIKNSLFIDFREEVFSSNYEIKQFNYLSQRSENTLYKIFLENVTCFFDHSNQKKGLFNLPQTVITVQKNRESRILLLTNSTPPYPYYPQIQYFSQQENIYELAQQVTFLQFTSIQIQQFTFLKDFEINIQQNVFQQSNQTVTIYQGQFLLISLLGYIKQGAANTDDRNISVIKFDLQQLAFEEQKASINCIEFFNEILSIKTFEVNASSNNEENLDKFYCQDFFEWKMSYQGIILQFTSIPCQKISFVLKIEYCPFNQFSYNGQCLEKCEDYHINGYCTEQCPEGYTIVDEQKQCIHCKDAIKVIDILIQQKQEKQLQLLQQINQSLNTSELKLKQQMLIKDQFKIDLLQQQFIQQKQQCKTCIPIMKMADGNCVAECPKNQIQMGQQCQECDCSIDSLKPYCKDCQINTEEYCEQGKYYYNEQCLSCPKGCKICDHQYPFRCLQCHDNFIISKNNVCIRKQNEKYCYPGYQYLNNACIQCNEGCQQCQNDDSNKCQTCLSQYVKLLEGEQIICSKCQFGYFSYDNVCSQCSPQCSIQPFGCYGPSKLQCNQQILLI